MITYHDDMDQGRLREMLHYDQASGVFTWLKPTKYHPRMIDQTAGCPSTGYVLIRINGKKYKAHRLAWLYVHGRMPKNGIDHKDGNPFNNAISNLREASQAQNGANAKRWAGKALPKGVRLNGSGYTARISFAGQLRTIGTYSTPDEAAAAYAQEAAKLYGEFARPD